MDLRSWKTEKKLSVEKPQIDAREDFDEESKNKRMLEYTKKIKELRESTGMNRKEFCEYFDIPYRTVSEWERDGRHAPDYLIRLLEYYIRMEKVVKKETKDE